MEEITPITRTIKKVEGEKGTRFHCLGPHNPHYYMQNGILVPINVLAIAKDQLTTGKLTADIRGSHVVSVGLNKADTYEKFIGFRRDDKQDGSEQFEISYLGATYNGIAYSSDPFAKKTLSGFTNRVGNLHVFSNRHRTRLALPATKSVGKFRIQFKIHTVGLTAKQVGQDFHFVNAKGEFRFGLRKPSILGGDYEPIRDKDALLFDGAVAHHLEDLGKGEYLYTKESTDLFKGMPDAYMIDAETVYAETSDGMVERKNAGGTWSSVRTATEGTSLNSSSTNAFFVRTSRDGTFNFIDRSFFTFDTAGLGTVLTAVFKVYVTNIQNSGGSYSVVILEGTQASTLTVDDYDAFTGDYIASWGKIVTTSAWATSTDFAGDINTSGNTLLCVRANTYDYTSDTPSVPYYRSISIRYADYENTTYDPYLSITLLSFTPRIIMVC